MDNEFVRKRITQLRIQKGVSEYKISLDLGHSKGYIQSISSGRALPSLPELLYICEYFDITPEEFFRENLHQPSLSHELEQILNQLSSEDMCLILRLAKRLVYGKGEKDE